jgi:ribosome recycling factor
VYDCKPKMQQVTKHLAEHLRGIRTGTVSIGLIHTIRVDCQGTTVPISRLGSVRSQGDRIVIVPFDRSQVAPIVKALCESRLSAYALNPTTVSVSVPPLSVEQRDETIRHVKKLGEDAKIAIRTIRQQARKQIEASGRGSLRKVQEATDAAVNEIDNVVTAKVAELT